MASDAAGRPPTPDSLLGLPDSWLLQLARTSALDNDRTTLLALFRTCTFFRDAVAQHRKSHLALNVPIAAGRFQDEVDRLCGVARRSRNIELRLSGPHTGDEEDEEDEEGTPVVWTETEPHVTHLLVCAMARLGGEQPLAGVKRISLESLQLTALVPAWIRVLCPNVESLAANECTFAARPERVNVIPLAANAPTSPTAPHPPAPVACSRLQSLTWVGGDELQQDDQPLLALVQQQLAALPSLVTLLTEYWDFTALDHVGSSVLSTSLTRLVLTRHDQPTLPQRLPAMFPRLRELELTWGSVTDPALDGLLRHLGHVDVSFTGFDLKQSFTHRAWPWPHLKVWQLDVDSFARLPLHGILSCSVGRAVQTSANAQAVARVAEAVRRWGGLGAADELYISGHSSSALLTTLGPLLAALPEEQRRHVRLNGLDAGDVSPELLRRLGVALPPSVKRLSLSTMGSNLAQAAWRALLPSLPATVERVDLYSMEPTEQQLVDMCSAATRRVKVAVWMAPDKLLAAVRARLADLGGGGTEEPLVTLAKSYEA